MESHIPDERGGNDGHVPVHAFADLVQDHLARAGVPPVDTVRAVCQPAQDAVGTRNLLRNLPLAVVVPGAFAIVEPPDDPVVGAQAQQVHVRECRVLAAGEGVPADADPVRAGVLELDHMLARWDGHLVVLVVPALPDAPLLVELRLLPLALARAGGELLLVDLFAIHPNMQHCV